MPIEAPLVYGYSRIGNEARATLHRGSGEDLADQVVTVFNRLFQDSREYLQFLRGRKKIFSL